MRRVVFSLLLAATAAGCTSAGMNLQRASARAIMPTPNPDSVVVTEIHRGVITARWVATTSSGVYDCSLQADEKIPICARRDKP